MNEFLLYWAIMAVSLFNAILLLWLGITVLLNSDKRTIGIWAAGAGLFLGSAFFFAHTVIIDRGVVHFGWLSMLFWWTMAGIPAIILPYAWYVIMLWYSGFWNGEQSKLHRRQRNWLLFISMGLGMGLLSLFVGVVLMTFSSPFLDGLRTFMRWSIAGIPMLAAAYSAYVVLCFGLSLDAVRRPGPSRRAMGNLARQRAQPWLTAASLAMLVVSFVVMGTVLWLVQDVQELTLYNILQQYTVPFYWIDIFVASLIGFAITMLGQAIISYEVFTGKTLPRSGLARHWRNAVLLAAVYGLVIGGSMAINLRSLYVLIATAVLMTIFFAMFAWSSYAERERYIAQLRPFIASNRLYEQLLTQSTPPELDIEPAFHALCFDVLYARVAYLAALGPTAPLVGPPLSYPSNNITVLPPLTDLVAQLDSPKIDSLSIDPKIYGGAVWAIPLWSERGLIGIFLLGEKRGGGMYAQEEIEIARITGERLIDTRASAEMARRLMTIQRERLAQSQVVDQQTRRVLHDDILPSLQLSLIKVSSSQLNTDRDEIVESLTAVHRQISDLLHNMPTVTAPDVARLGLLTALHRTVDNELAQAFDEVTWHIDPAAAEKVREIPSLTAETIFYAAREVVRNAARYGRNGDGSPFSLCIDAGWHDGLRLQIEDNGVGLETTADTNKGTGQGLALHSTMMAVVGGTLETDSVRGQYTRVVITLPESN
jgi:signal transduction histidine kinase